MSLFSTSVMNDIMAQLKQQNPSLPSTVTPEDVRLTLVKSLSNHSSGKNTRAVVSVIDHGRVKGFKPIYYNRVNLGSVLRNISYVFPKGSASRLSDLLPAINGRYGLGLTVNDIVDVNLPITDGVVGITLQTKPKSLSWYGSATLFVESSSVQVNRPPRTTAVVNLGFIERDTGLTVTQGMLLANVVDDDGDTLTISNLQATSVNGVILGTGPWIFSGLSNGSFTVSYTVSDGHGGSVIQYAVLEVIEPATNEVLPPFTFQMIPTIAAELDSTLLLGDAVTDLTVSGNFVQGSVLTVSSSTLPFIGGMPEKQVYNDYSTAIPGQQVQTLAELGTWDRGHPDNGKYAAGGMNGRPAVYYCNHEDGGKVSRRNIVYSPGFGEAFCASSLKVPPGKTLGGANQYWPNSIPVPRTIIGRSQLKMFWLNVNDGGGEPADLIMPTLVSQTWQYGGNSHALTAWGNVDVEANSLWDWDGWNFFRCWAKHNPADWDAGTMQLEISSSMGRNKKSMLGPVLNDTADAPLFNDIAFGKWTEDNSLTQILNGDVYIAIGPNAPCRVEIGDKPVYSQCKSLAICPPLSWNQDTRTAQFRYSNGDLVSGRPQFVYVFNKDNELINTQGKLINYTATETLQGGTSALSWRAAGLSNGQELVIETDNTYDFGVGPTEVKSFGFGSGYLYEQPLLKVLQDGETAGPFYVAEGGARRIEEIDGIRVLASRLRDANGWAGYQSAGRIIDYQMNPPLGPNEKVAFFRLYRADYPGTVLNWQLKTARYLCGDRRLDSNVYNEAYLKSFKDHTNAIETWDGTGVTATAPIVHPHANQGWTFQAAMLDTGNLDTANGRILTRLVQFGSGRHMEEADSPLRIIDSQSDNRISDLGFQDYFDGTNFSAEQIASGLFYEPTDINQYTTDYLLQRGSFAHAVLADGPTPLEAEHAVPVVPKSWSRNRIVLHQWQSLVNFTVKYIFIYNDEGTLVATLHLTGTYVPPPWDQLNDVKGVVRGTGSNATAKSIILNGLWSSSNTQKWEFMAKPTSLTSILGVCGVAGDTTKIFAFNPDGSISLRMPGMTQTTLVRAAGPHVLSTVERQKITLECIAGTQINVLVNDVVVGSHSGTGLSLIVNRLMESGLSNSGFVGAFYNAVYYENGVMVNRYKFDEGSGIVANDDIGGTTASVGSSLTWVS